MGIQTKIYRCRRATFGALPDDVLLEIFNLYLDGAVEDGATDG